MTTVASQDMKGERRVQLYELLKEACVTALASECTWSGVFAQTWHVNFNQVMASLSHPNICTFVGVSMDADKKRLFSKGRQMQSDRTAGCEVHVAHN